MKVFKRKDNNNNYKTSDSWSCIRSIKITLYWVEFFLLKVREYQSKTNENLL